MSNDVLLVPINVEQPNVEAQSDVVVYVPQAHKNKAGIVKEGEGIIIENGVVSLDTQTVEDMIDANKWVSYGFQQNLTEDEKGMARHNIGAGDNDFTGSYYDVTQKPHLSTDNSVSLPIGDEEINNTVQLHKISKTGSFNDLNDVPHETLDFAESERQKSKNLLPLENRLEQTSQGISYARRFDGAIVLYGANEGVANSSYAVATNFTLKAGTYTTSVRGATGVDLILTDDVRYLSGTFTLNEDTSFTLAYIQVPASNTTFFNQVPIWLQVEEGSVVTEWQYPYGAISHKGDAEIQFAETEREKSKNLLPVMSTAEFITIGENGLITFNGTVGAWTHDIFKGEIYLKKGKTYTLSIHNYSGSGKQLLIFRAKKVSDGTEIREYLYTYGTEGRVTPTEDVILITGGFYFANEVTVNFSCFVQIEEGDVVTDYQPYNGAIVHKKDIADVEHVDVLYDVNTQPIINGQDYSQGFHDGYAIHMDFSKYKKVKALLTTESELSNSVNYCYPLEIDLRHISANSSYRGTASVVNPYCVLSDKSISEIRVALGDVNLNKDTLVIDILSKETTSGGVGDSGNKIVRLEGVY